MKTLLVRPLPYAPAHEPGIHLRVYSKKDALDEIKANPMKWQAAIHDLPDDMFLASRRHLLVAAARVMLRNHHVG